MINSSSLVHIKIALLLTIGVVSNGALAAFGGEDAPTIGSFTEGLAPVTPGGYVSLYAKNVAGSNSGAIAGVRFYRESNGTSGLQIGSDTYIGTGVYANSMWTYAAATSGLSGSPIYYAVAFDTGGNTSSSASVTSSIAGSGFSNWSALQPFLAKVPLSIGYIASTSIVNFGTTIYTGPLDTTITLDRIRGDNGPNRSGDGASFTNNGNPPLPTNRGSVYEFTINPQTGCSPNWTTAQIAFPGPIRFMINTSGDVYFTGDHYATDRNLYVSGTPLVGSVVASPATATEGTPVTLTASGVSEAISPLPNLNPTTGGNILATVSNVQFFLETNGTSGLQTDTDRLLGSGSQIGGTWTLDNVSTGGLAAGTHTVYAVGVDPAGNFNTRNNTLTIVSASPHRTAFDFDGDGKTDLSIFRPATAEWYYQKSSTGVTNGFQFGSSTDRVTPADFTGDGKTDIAFWRPSSGQWYILRSEDSTFYAFPFGANGDIPAPADFDGDGRADAAVYRPSVSTWFILPSTGGVASVQFGISTDLPEPSDYDGDGKADIAIFRPSAGEWWVYKSSNQQVLAAQFGQSTDVAAPGDFTGDGKSDMAFFRPSNGNWYILRSENLTYYAFPFGVNGDRPVPGDYDGDGIMDPAVFRGANANWYASKSTGGVLIQQYGLSGDIPLPSVYVR